MVTSTLPRAISDAADIHASSAELPLLLRIDDVARLLSVSRATAYRAVLTGELPSVRISERVVRVPRLALLAWLAERGAVALSESASQDGAA